MKAFAPATLCLFIVAIPAFCPAPIRAREFTVNQTDPKASDENDGSREKPLRTISAAAAHAGAGDHVIIHSGEYREVVIITASGTPTAPIVFEAAPGQTPVIKGSEIVAGWSRKSPNLWSARLPASAAVHNREAASWNTNDVRQIFLQDGVLLDAIRLRPGPADSLRQGNFCCDRAKNELYLWVQASQDPNKLKIEASVRGAWMYIYGSNVIVRGLEMRHSSTSAFANWPACVIKGDNVTLEDCRLTWSDYVGVGLSGNHDKLLRCTIACNGNSGIGGSGEAHLIDLCQVLYNNVERYYPGWHCGGAKLIPAFRKSRISRTEFAHNIGPGLWLDSGCDDNTIAGNFIHDNEGPGIEVEISARNRVFNNISVGNRNPTTAEFLEPDIDAEKRGEHGRYKSVRHGGEMLAQSRYHAGDGRGIFISSSPETKVFHNTCYLNEGEGICVEGPLRNDSGSDMSSRDSTVLNNISAYNKGAQLVLRRNGSDKNTRGNKSDYNLLVALGAVLAHSGWDAPFTQFLKEWQQKSGNDTHSIQADPAYAMAAMMDFRLLPISPAVRKAPALTDVATDFYGNPRPAGLVSMGACEETDADYPRSALSALRAAALSGDR